MPERDTQFLKGILTMLLLSLLNEEEDYGYSTVIRLQSLGFADLREGTVYPALTRLEKNGWLSSRLVASDSGPARKYYAPTSDGRLELKKQQQTWADLVQNVNTAIGATANADSSTSSSPREGIRKT